MNRIDPANWLRLLDAVCAKVHRTQVDFLIDQVGIDVPLLAGIRTMTPRMPWHALFDGLPEAGHTELSPLLVRIDLAQPLQRLWLEDLIEVFGDDARLLALVSTWPFQRLGEHLGQCLEARNGGVSGVLRYYDPRLFPLLFSHVLTPEQQQRLLHPALIWSWLDRDGILRRLAGASTAPARVETPAPFELSDKQIDVLCCAADACAALGRVGVALPEDWGGEQRFRACYQAMLDVSQAGPMPTAQSDALLLDKLLATRAGLQGGGRV